MHVDMDAFYASVEQLDHPEYRGRPLVVGGGGPRSVVAAASYEVRNFGVRSAMSMAEALRRCPDLIRVQPRMQRYRMASRQIFTLFRQVSPLVQGLSLDEAYLDVTEQASSNRQFVELGRAIKRQIRDQVGLTASVGLGPNKLVAKIASDLGKPDGLVLVRPDQVQATLDPLPVRSISGIGPRTGEALASLGIRTIAQLRQAPPELLAPVFGRFVTRMQQRAAGIDPRPVEPVSQYKSISAEETFDQDLRSLTDMQAHIEQLAERTARRLASKRLCASTVWIKIRERNFRTTTRQHSFTPATQRAEHIIAAARLLLLTWRRDHPSSPVRLLGVGVSGLEAIQQMDLFGEQAGAQEDLLGKLIEDVRQRYGQRALGKGHPDRRA